MPYAHWAGVRLGLMYYVSMTFLGLTLLLRLLSIPGLFAKTKAGWRMLYYSTLLNLVYAIFSYNLFSGLIGIIIGFYFLFQVREYYK